jgi:hypothetical protein
MPKKAGGSSEHRSAEQDSRHIHPLMPPMAKLPQPERLRGARIYTVFTVSTYRKTANGFNDIPGFRTAKQYTDQQVNLPPVWLPRWV